MSDLGDRFEITALGQTQQYVDPGRDCAERARVAAVFIALALSPPTFQRRPAPPPPAEVEARPGPPPPPAAADTSGGWAGLALDARIDGGSAGGDSSSTLVAAGADLRATVGRRALGLVATAGLLSPTHSRFQSVPVRQQRFPFSLAVIVRRGAVPALAASATVGVALVPFTLQGDGLATPAPATRLDTGAHLALALELPPPRRADDPVRRRARRLLSTPLRHRRRSARRHRVDRPPLAGRFGGLRPRGAPLAAPARSAGVPLSFATDSRKPRLRRGAARRPRLKPSGAHRRERAPRR